MRPAECSSCKLSLGTIAAAEISLGRIAVKCPHCGAHVELNWQN